MAAGKNILNVDVIFIPKCINLDFYVEVTLIIIQEFRNTRIQEFGFFVRLTGCQDFISKSLNYVICLEPEKNVFTLTVYGCVICVSDT